MSNYNSTLQSNNIDLQTILNTINELPEADGEPVLQDKTVTPSTNKQTITADSGYDGLDTITVNAIPNEYITTSDATASNSDILSGETAYVNGEKVTGTFTIDNELATQDDLIAQIQATVEGLPEASGGSSGGGVETCTLIIDSSSVGYPINNYYATVVNDGVICAQYYLNVGTSQISIDNVVCGSVLTVTLAGNAIPNPSGAEYLYAGVYEITASSGETATISYMGI